MEHSCDDTANAEGCIFNTYKVERVRHSEVFFDMKVEFGAPLNGDSEFHLVAVCVNFQSNDSGLCQKKVRFLVGTKKSPSVSEGDFLSL